MTLEDVTKRKPEPFYRAGGCGGPKSRAVTARAPTARPSAERCPAPCRPVDRWHMWHLLAEAVRKQVAAHSACWAATRILLTGPERLTGGQAETLARLTAA
jgi:hypothetical protein